MGASLHGEHVGDRQINVVDIFREELFVLFEIEEAHIHELAKSYFGSLRKVGIFLTFKFHAILDFSQICILVLDAGLLNCGSHVIGLKFMHLRHKNFVLDLFLEE